MVHDKVLRSGPRIETLATLFKRPEDRGTVVNKLVNQIGGKLVGYWLSFGEHDGVVVVEGSDNVGAAAVSMAVAPAAHSRRQDTVD